MVAAQRRRTHIDFSIATLFSSIANVIVTDIRLVGLGPVHSRDIRIAALTGIVGLVLVEAIAIAVDKTIVRQEMIDAFAFVVTVSEMTRIDGRIHAFCVVCARTGVATIIDDAVTIIIFVIATKFKGFRRYFASAFQVAKAVARVNARLTDADA